MYIASNEVDKNGDFLRKVNERCATQANNLGITRSRKKPVQ